MVIKTSDEGTSYCTQCEAYAKEIGEILRLLARERDEFAAKELTLMAHGRLRQTDQAALFDKFKSKEESEPIIESCARLFDGWPKDHPWTIAAKKIRALKEK